MKNSQEANEPNNHPSSFNAHSQSHISSIQDEQDVFSFLKIQENPSKRPSFFSKMGLGQDIIKVTDAKPDTCLEVFYALYHVLWPQIEKQSSVSLKDAWTNFIGGSIFKGVLCSPEKLVGKRRLKDIKNSLAEGEEKSDVFQDLDRVVNLLLNLKKELAHYSEKISQFKEVMASLELVQGFYTEFRSEVIDLVRRILEKESMDKNPMSEYHDLENLLEPKAVMMSDTFTHHWAYRIPRNTAQKLLSFDEDRRRIKNNSADPSSHPVIALPENMAEPLVYFKANGGTPIQPEKEFMLYSLYRRFQIPVPETALVILTNVFEEDAGYFYAVQASEAVIGESALEACKNQETVFEQEAYALQVIGTLLTNPSDGSFKNFKYSPRYKTLVSVDNDLVFKPEFSGKDDRKIVNIKSILYLLPQIDLPIPTSTKTVASTFDPHLMILSWLKDLSQKNKEYSLLFARLAFQNTRWIYQSFLPQSEVLPLAVCLEQQVFIDPDLHNDSFWPQILVSENLLNNVSKKLQIMEKTLLNNHSVNTQILFEEIYPLLGKYYRKLRFEFSNPEEALDALWGEKKKNGVDYSEILSLLNQEELKNSSQNNGGSDKNLLPEIFLNEYKEKLVSGKNLPLDKFIQRHGQRKRKNILNLNQALEELQLLIQEGFVDSQSSRDIVDFCYNISKMTEADLNLTNEITSILSNLQSAELKWLFTLEKYFKRTDCDVIGDYLIPITGAFMKKRIFPLTESEKQFIFDNKGHLQKNSSLTGRSRVTCFPEKNPEFYLKEYPEFPGYEFASTMFMRLLGIKYLPYHDLIIIDNSYPVLISQKVRGNPVHKIWNNPLSFSNLDPTQTGLLIIAAMLLNPEDAKEDNWILSEDGRYLIPIDNDHCFLPSTFQKEGNFWSRGAIPALQTKTLLFCLDEMKKPISLEVKQQILGINFDKELELWITELDKLETRFNNLVIQEQRTKFLEKGTVMRIPFYKQFIHNIHWKAHKIQNILKAAADPTPFDLLKAIEPFAALCYDNSFKQGPDLEKRFQRVTKQLYTKATIDGSRVSIINTQSMVEILGLSKEDLQNDAMFQKMGPVDVLGLLKELIREHNERIGKEQELLCELDEKNEEKKFIGLFGRPSMETALKDFFTNPKEGLVLKGSKLVVSSKLTEFFALTPDQGIKLKFLSLQDSPLLTHRTVRTLAQGCPNLEYLNVSGCGKLKEIFMAKEEWPLLERVEARDCPALERLVSYSPLKILRIETDCEMEILVARSTLDVFTISRKSTQFYFSFKKVGGFEIKFRGQKVPTDHSLIKLIRGKDEFKKYFREMKLTIGMNTISSGNDLGVFIMSLNLRACFLQLQDIQRMVGLKLINLQRLDMALNQGIKLETLSCLIERSWPKLNHLDLSFNEFEEGGVQLLCQGEWPLLETLHLQFTKVTEKDVEVIVNRSKWGKLKSLNLYGNEIQDKGLEILSQGNWPLLEFLNLKKTNITAVGIEALRAKWPLLRDLNLSQNSIDDQGLEALSLENWPLLEILYLEDTIITKKRFFYFVFNRSWNKLKNIVFSSDGKNFSNRLFQKNSDQLEYLDLSSGEITIEEVKIIVNQCKWPKLKYLDLSHNLGINDEGLEILGQGNWPKIETLNLDSTGVTKKGIFHFILNTNWSHLEKLSSNLDEQSFPDGFLRRNWDFLQDLDLSSGHITQNEIEIIRKKCKWPYLKHLNLSDNSEINDETLAIISQEGNWPFLETLKLGKTKITNVGIETIIKWSNWPELTEIDLSLNQINDQGLQILNQGNWPLLETLILDSTDVTKKELFYFILNAKWSNLKIISSNLYEQDFLNCIFLKNSNLVDLDLSSSHLTQNEIKMIVKNLKCKQLKHLNLSDNSELNDEAFAIISQEGNWPFLEILRLAKTKITAFGVKASKWPRLKHIDLSSNQINDEELGKLTEGIWPELETLNLDSTNVTKKRFIYLIQHASWPKFKKITLPKDWNPVWENLTKEDLVHTEKLELVNFNMPSTDLEIIINYYPRLKSINLSDNDISLKGCSVLTLADCCLLEELRLENTKIGPEGISILVNQQEWPKLKHLTLSNNQIFDEGISILALAEWPLLEELHLEDTKITKHGLQALVNQMKLQNLKKLDISKNEIFDEGLKILALGKWPSFQHLVYYNTKVTSNGNVFLLENSKWPNLQQLEPSFPESFYNYDEKLKNWSRPEAIRTVVSIEYQTQPLLAIVLNTTWQSPIDVYLSTFWNNRRQKILLFGRDKWNQLEYVKLSPKIESAQPIVLPSSLKKLDASNTTFSGENKLQIILQENCPLLENLNLSNIGITTKSVELLITLSDWPCLRKLDISNNLIGNEGLALLFCQNWHLLEDLSLHRTGITEKGVESMVNLSKWPLLKALDISWNSHIFDEGLGALASGKWPLLESLNLEYTNFNLKDLETLAEKSSWPNLKEIYIKNYFSAEMERIILRKWPNIKLKR